MGAVTAGKLKEQTQKLDEITDELDLRARPAASALAMVFWRPAKAKTTRRLENSRTENQNNVKD